jgi:hypothetical protein
MYPNILIIILYCEAKIDSHISYLESRALCSLEVRPIQIGQPEDWYVANVEFEDKGVYINY